MLAPDSPVYPSIIACASVYTLAMVAMLLIGWWLTRGMGHDPMPRLLMSLAVGLVCAAAVSATILLGRWSYLGIVPCVHLLAALCPPANAPAPQTAPLPWKALLVTALGVFAATWFQQRWWDNTGHFVQINMDLGYFAQVAKGLPSAGVMSGWAALLGDATAKAVDHQDFWYHWAPLWLTASVARLFAMPELQAQLLIVAPLMNLALVGLLACIAQHFTLWRWGRCLLLAVAAMVAQALPTMSEVALLSRITPGEVLAHVHTSLAYQFSYKFEALLALAALVCWLKGARWLALALVFNMVVWSPHGLGCGGAITGCWMVLGFLRRDAAQWKPATLGVVFLILGWVWVRFISASDFQQSSAAQLTVQGWAGWSNGVIGALRAVGWGLLLHALLLPGIWAWLRAPQAQARAVGWLILASMLGSMTAYHTLLPNGDRGHFTQYAHTLIVLPLSFIGLALWMCQNPADRRHVALILMVSTLGLGLYDLINTQNNVTPEPITMDEIAQVRAKLAGEPCGYFALNDRDWWMSQHAALGGALDARLVRLNRLREVEQTSSNARFYGTDQPLRVVPPIKGETDEEWSRRFAERLGVHHVIEIGSARRTSPAPTSKPPTLETEHLRLMSYP